MNKSVSSQTGSLRFPRGFILSTLCLAVFATACQESAPDAQEQPPVRELRGERIVPAAPTDSVPESATAAPAPAPTAGDAASPDSVPPVETASTSSPTQKNPEIVEATQPGRTETNAGEATAPAESFTAPAADAAADPEAESAVEVAGVGGDTDADAGLDADGEFKTVGFEKLSAFEFEMSDDILNPPDESDTNITARTDAMIPKEIRAFDNQRVALKGFMLPLKVEGGLVTELLVMKDQSMCCFGTVPKINEWVSVKMIEKGVKPIMDQPVTLFGKLNVGEMRENGYLVGIYSMDGEKMAGPLDN